MKKIKFIALFMMLLATSLAYSQTPKQKGNYKAQFPFSVDSVGAIKDASGTTLGTVSKEGIIKNHKGEKVAFIDDNGNLVDSKGKIMGKAAKNGNYHTNKGELIYTVKPTKGQQCEVYDKSGKVIASVHDNYKLQAGCVAHCMKTGMLMK